MCTTCGCDAGATPRVTSFDGHGPREHDRGHSYEPAPAPQHGHPHPHGHEDAHDRAHPHDPAHAHDHAHPHDPSPVRRQAPEPPEGAAPRAIRLEQEILERNDRSAAQNRGWLEGRGVAAWNLMSAPGAGKTTLLERTIRDLGSEVAIGVIEGDQATLHDAERIRAAGGRVVQINTGTGCHLDADMIADALRRLDPPSGSRLVIENVGNLVCPALFDLGETARAVIVSVTEGEDKPIKYPHMFRAAELMILNKIDLLPYVPFDADRCVEWARRVNPRIEVLRVSALTGEGLAGWYERLRGGPVQAERGA